MAIWSYRQILGLHVAHVFSEDLARLLHSPVCGGVQGRPPIHVLTVDVGARLQQHTVQQEDNLTWTLEKAHWFNLTFLLDNAIMFYEYTQEQHCKRMRKKNWLENVLWDNTMAQWNYKVNKCKKVDQKLKITKQNNQIM